MASEDSRYRDGFRRDSRCSLPTFTVDKADNPLRETWPFLLIVRTGWIFTAHVRTTL